MPGCFLNKAYAGFAYLILYKVRKMLEPRHNEGRGAWLNWFAKEVSLYRGSFRSLYQGLRSLGPGSALWEKGEKSALAKKKNRRAKRAER